MRRKGSRITARSIAFLETGAQVQAVVLTRNDPVRLNACLWSLFNQTTRPGGILIVSTGGWATGDVGGTIDIISERIPITIRRIPNADLGTVHAKTLSLSDYPYTWFFQDDAVAHFRCLEEQVMTAMPSLPVIMYPDYEPFPGEEIEIPQEVATLDQATSEKMSRKPKRGPCLGLLLDTDSARSIAKAVKGYPMGLDDMLVQLAKPTLAEEAFVFHTRPEKPQWKRIVKLMKEQVLPNVKLEDE